MMKKTLIAAGILATQALFTQAFAQGEVGPVKRAQPAAQVSEQEKQEARQERKAEGEMAARQQPQGKVGPVRKPASPQAGAQSTVDPDTRKAEAQAANKAMNRSTMPQRGEVGQTKAN